MAIVAQRRRYGLEIKREFERRTGRRLSLGRLYVALRALEGLGLIGSEWGEATLERGGNRRKYFFPSAAGRARGELFGTALLD